MTENSNSPLTGGRIDDPPPKEQPLKFRLGLASRKYPVHIALVIALLVMLVPLYLLIASNGDLRASNQHLRTALVVTQTTRVTTLASFCHVINRNARTANTQTDYLKGILINGAKASKAFERTFRQLGLPPYKVRLKQAEKQASGLDRVKLPALNCTKFIDAATRQIRKLTGLKQ